MWARELSQAIWPLLGRMWLLKGWARGMARGLNGVQPGILGSCLQKSLVFVYSVLKNTAPNKKSAVNVAGSSGNSTKNLTYLKGTQPVLTSPTSTTTARPSARVRATAAPLLPPSRRPPLISLLYLNPRTRSPPTIEAALSLDILYPLPPKK